MNRYFQSALKFFENKYQCKVNCDIEFIENENNLCGLITKGSYHIIKNNIKIFGCGVYSRNELVKILFHELVHYWQSKIVNKLKCFSEIRFDGLCQDFSEQSLIKDIYHCHKHIAPVVYYNKTNTNNISYDLKPHEIEARELSKTLFGEWNTTEHKEKV